MNGGELQMAIIEAGHTFGWKFAHFRPCRTTQGWRTAVGADGKGWPDLYMIHPERREHYYREIKGAKEAASPEQKVWGEWLLKAGEDWAIWRPSQWNETIVPLLTFGRGRTA